MPVFEKGDTKKRRYEKKADTKKARHEKSLIRKNVERAVKMLFYGIRYAYV